MREHDRAAAAAADGRWQPQLDLGRFDFAAHHDESGIEWHRSLRPEIRTNRGCLGPTARSADDCGNAEWMMAGAAFGIKKDRWPGPSHAGAGLLPPRALECH
jgi:hypothetical protein